MVPRALGRKRPGVFPLTFIIFLLSSKISLLSWSISLYIYHVNLTLPPPSGATMFFQLVLFPALLWIFHIFPLVTHPIDSLFSYSSFTVSPEIWFRKRKPSETNSSSSHPWPKAIYFYPVSSFPIVSREKTPSSLSRPTLTFAQNLIPSCLLQNLAFWIVSSTSHIMNHLF